jgi:hypoxanthine phosphoribosyltransferase
VKHGVSFFAFAAKKLIPFLQLSKKPFFFLWNERGKLYFCIFQNTTIMKSVTIKDKEFGIFIESKEIERSIEQVSQKINADLKDQNPIFVAILNGAFMFAAELMKRVSIPCEITFVRLASYRGTSSTENVKEVLGLNESIEGRTIVIVEDIVDTGNTMAALLKQFEAMNPKEIRIASLLFKPEALKKDIKLDYVALEIPSDFIVGYGLDYDGYGRNLNDIYKLKS